MKVAIVCGAPSSEFFAPYDDLSWEIWVLGNRVDRHLDKRITRIFEIHDNLIEHGDVGVYKSKLHLLAKNYQVIVSESFSPLSPNMVVFPYAAVEKLYGSIYLTSSPAYMISYAILQGATEIAIYGVDLSVSDHEYFWQRPCAEAWIGFAKGRGIKVYIPPVSHIGKSDYVEGRDWGVEKENGLFSENDFMAQAADCTAKKEALHRQRQDLAIKAAAIDGAEQVYRHLAKVARAKGAKVDVKTLTEVTLLR